MTFSHLLLILRSRIRLVVGVWLAVLALIVVASLVFPARYKAAASVVVDVKSPDPIVGAVLPGGLAPGFMSTQQDVLTSERVILRAIRAMHLTENPSLRADWLDDTDGRGSFESWIAELIYKKFDVKPSKDSNAMTLTYVSPSPEFSAEMVNALMQAYIDTTLDLRVEPARQYRAFFDQRSKQLRDELEKAQARLSEYQQKTGLLATDERLDVEGAHLAELTSQVVALSSEAIAAKGRQSQVGSNTVSMQEVLNNPVVAQLTTDLSHQQANLEQLNSRLGRNHPQVRELQSNIAELKGRLKAATAQASGSVGVTSRVADTRLAGAQAALAAQRTKMLKLKADRDQAAVLQRDIESAQRSYDLTLTRGSQAEMESEVRETNVAVLKRATPPPFPSFPKLWLNVAIGVVLGLFAGAAAAILKEGRDRRLRTIDDVTAVLGQTLLVRLSSSRLSGRKRDSRGEFFEHRVLTGLARPAGT